MKTLFLLLLLLKARREFTRKLELRQRFMMMMKTMKRMPWAAAGETAGAAGLQQRNEQKHGQLQSTRKRPSNWRLCSLAYSPNVSKRCITATAMAVAAAAVA
jgi:hypothetical protein